MANARAREAGLGAPFKRYWAAAAISSFGASVTAVAMPVFVVQHVQASAFEVGLVNAAQLIPYAVLELQETLVAVVITFCVAALLVCNRCPGGVLVGRFCVNRTGFRRERWHTQLAARSGRDGARTGQPCRASAASQNFVRNLKRAGSPIS